MNSVQFLGRLTASPELNQTGNGKSYSRFSIAVRRKMAQEGQQQVDFINCVAWGKTAEFLCKYFAKGDMIAVSGELRQNTYTDKDGNNRSSYEVVVSEIFFAQSKRSGDAPEPRQEHEFAVVDDDSDLPF